MDNQTYFSIHSKRAWSDEEESNHEGIANMCFMAIKEDIDEDSSELGLIADEGTSEEHRKKNRKGKWYLDSTCSRHMTSDKQMFKTVTKLDGAKITFGDKSKGNIIGVGRVPLSSTCNVDEIYLVDELGYDYEVRFKKHGWFIKEESESIHVIFVDTNPRLRNEKLLEDKEIFIVPKSTNTGENTHDEVTDQQDQSTNSPIDNQEPPTIDQSNSVEKEPVSVVPNEWKSKPGYPYTYIIENPHEEMKTRRSLKQTSNIALISQFEPKKVDEALGDKSWITAMKEKS
uniref:Retrovirus-related Pol polyprotein from transposon TNT 1-94-like beta-barrel domain-containing protein n=1 Tax=Nicotiana tabacum TaxID=4097 RepID=A0A1S4B8R0_TOBAC|nr:PREDICTED: uncharacterized protein LOC107805756 [Nicotiana tabacum]